MAPVGGARPGAGRKKKTPAEKSKNRGIQVTDADWAKIKKLAADARMSISAFVRWKCLEK